MSKRKNPHPAGGTAEQGDNGAVWADGSHDSDFTGGGAGCQGRIYPLLLKGEENALPAADLTRLAGYKNQRSMRVAIDQERERGLPVLASEHGYYRPADGNQGIMELRRFVRRTDARAASNRRTIRLIRAQLRELEKKPLEGQETLWDEGDV